MSAVSGYISLGGGDTGKSLSDRFTNLPAPKKKPMQQTIVRPSFSSMKSPLSKSSSSSSSKTQGIVGDRWPTNGKGNSSQKRQSVKAASAARRSPDAMRGQRKQIVVKKRAATRQSQVSAQRARSSPVQSNQGRGQNKNNNGNNGNNNNNNKNSHNNNNKNNNQKNINNSSKGNGSQKPAFSLKKKQQQQPAQKGKKASQQKQQNSKGGKVARNSGESLTAEQLDAQMDSYFNPKAAAPAKAAAAAVPAAAAKAKGGGGGKKKGKQAGKPEASAEALDAEMDAYFNQK
jgi:hypothetical protein